MNKAYFTIAYYIGCMCFACYLIYTYFSPDKSVFAVFAGFIIFLAFSVVAFKHSNKKYDEIEGVIRMILIPLILLFPILPLIHSGWFVDYFQVKDSVFVKKFLNESNLVLGVMCCFFMAFIIDATLTFINSTWKSLDKKTFYLFLVVAFDFYISIIGKLFKTGSILKILLASSNIYIRSTTKYFQKAYLLIPEEYRETYWGIIVVLSAFYVKEVLLKHEEQKESLNTHKKNSI
jgi:hypothetical protein